MKQSVFQGANYIDPLKKKNVSIISSFCLYEFFLKQTSMFTQAMLKILI